ncbi:MAG: glycosyltransferase family 9 protein [Ktedonobacteraceae bacterium]
MRMLILRLAQIGDSLITFPIIRALREKYSDPHVTYIGNSAVLPIAQDWGLAEEVFAQGRLEYDKPLSEDRIRSSVWLPLLQQSDLVVYWLLYQDIDGHAGKDMLAAGARKVIIVDGFPQVDLSKHWMETMAAATGFPDLRANTITPFTSKKQDTEFCLYNPPIAIHPGCSDAERTWPAASFAAIINRLLKAQQPVLLLAGPDDDEQLQLVRKHLSPAPKPGLLTILKNAPIVEVARQIKKCRCYLGNDSGMTHLAALLGVPTIALFLPDFSVTMRPLGPSVEIIQARNLERLSVDRVLDSIRKHV